MTQQYIRYELIRVNEFVDLINEQWNNYETKTQRPNGKWVGCASLRLKNFARAFNANGKIACVTCGLEASIFAVESSPGQSRAHVNLYGVRDGCDVLFTHDHIVARALGGSDDLENTQVMCSPCNNKKSRGESKEVLRRRKLKEDKDAEIIN